MEFLPGVLEAIRLLNQAGYFVVVATNQRCVAKGLITASELEAMHARMRHDFEAVGATIDAIYYCPHELEPPCDCRKPSPGMLLEAARLRNLDLSSSWMIGDSEHDVEAGKHAGCRTARITDSPLTEASVTQTSSTQARESATGTADVVASSLLAATRKILELPAELPTTAPCC